PAAARHADRTRCSARMREEWRARIEAHAPRNRRMSKSYTHPILLSLYLACGAISANADADAASGPEAAHQVAQASGPQSRESLFGDDAGKPKAGKPSSREDLFGLEPARPAARPGSREELFGTDIPATKPAARLEAEPTSTDPLAGWRGYVQSEFAYTYENPEHWSKARLRLKLGRQG